MGQLGVGGAWILGAEALEGAGLLPRTPPRTSSLDLARVPHACLVLGPHWGSQSCRLSPTRWMVALPSSTFLRGAGVWTRTPQTPRSRPSIPSRGRGTAMEPKPRDPWHLEVAPGRSEQRYTELSIGHRVWGHPPCTPSMWKVWRLFRREQSSICPWTHPQCLCQHPPPPMPARKCTP